MIRRWRDFIERARLWMRGSTLTRGNASVWCISGPGSVCFSAVSTSCLNDWKLSRERDILDAPRVAVRLHSNNKSNYLPSNAKKISLCLTAPTAPQRLLKAFSFSPSWANTALRFPYCAPNCLKKLFICHPSVWGRSGGDPRLKEKWHAQLNEAAAPGVTGCNYQHSRAESTRLHTSIQYERLKITRPLSKPDLDVRKISNCKHLLRAVTTRHRENKQKSVFLCHRASPE